MNFRVLGCYTILSSLLCVCTQFATGQEYLTLKTGTFPLLSTESPSRNIHSAHYFFYKPGFVLTNSDKEDLAKSGVEVLRPLKQNVYWVRLTSTPQVSISRNLFDLDVNYKLGFSIEERASFHELRLSIAPGLTWSEISAWADLNEIILLDTRAIDFGILDVRISSDVLDILLNTPWISYIESIPKDVELNYRLLNAERGWGLKSMLTRGLDGNGMTIGIGDGGRLGRHEDNSNSVLDLASFGISDHATQVTGIVTGSGLLDPSFGFGYAPKANVLIRNFSDIIWDAPQYVEDFNLSLTNNSYSANPFDCVYIGDYNGTSTALDAMTNDLPTLLHVFAAGNSGNITCSPYPVRFATIAGGYQSAKNVLTVGAIGRTDLTVGFSSRGPVDDGRIKPEVVAYGQGRFSTVNNDQYTSNTGTSFSSPATMGMATLLYERYRELHNDSLPDAALIKNVICNGADDLGLAGPDFIYGFGRINGVRSVEILENGRFDSVLVNHNSTIQKTFFVPAGISSIDVMLMWSDYPSAPYETVALVNDLDLILIDPSGDTIRPWKLNNTPSGINLAATTGFDHTNNYEQVTVSIAEQGTYTILIKGFLIPMGPQLAWISWDLQKSGITIQSPIGGEIFKPGNPVLPNDEHYIRWDAFGTGTSTFTIEYSTFGDSLWTTIATNVTADRRYQGWFIPPIPTDQLKVRITASNGMRDTSDFASVIMAAPANLVVSSPCDEYAQLSWNSVPGADYYQVYSLKNELLTPLDTTSNLSIISGGFSEDNSQYLTVAGVFPSGIAGMRARAILLNTNGGNSCTWNHDIRLDTLSNPVSGRLFTSTSLSANETIQVYLTNAGLLSASGFSLSYKVNNSSTVNETFPGTINPGMGQSFSFSQPFDFSSSGIYQIKIWTTYPSDPFKQNDTLIVIIEHLLNPLLSLPWSESFEQAFDTQILVSLLGIPGLDKWDVILENDCRVRTFAGSPFCHTGQRALTMDAVKSVSNKTGELVLTMNMDNYSVLTDDIRMSLFYMHHEIIPDVINTESIWVRGSDTDPYVLVTMLVNEVETRGIWQHLTGLEISDILVQANQDFSSSFQIKFPFQVNATAGDPITQDGQTIDDITFQKIIRDVSLDSLLHPTAISCGLGMESIEVSVTNTTNLTVSNTTISYQVNGGSTLTTSVGTIPMDTTIVFVLSPPADFSNPGIYDLKVWTASTEDDFKSNDTLHQKILHSSLVSTYPYRESFESNSGGYFSAGINSTWMYGVPGKEIISRAAEGQKAWTTALAGTHNADEESYLYSPCFDLQGLVQPFLSFAFQYQLEVDYDYAWVEYRLGESDTWTKLGIQGNGTNWYNHNSNRWNGTQPKWVTTGIAIPFTDTTVQFRWVLQSDVGVELEGIAVDQVHVYDRVSIYTGAAMQWTIPVSGNDWVHVDQGGQRVFSIHPMGQNMGTVTLKLFKSNSNFLLSDSLYLMSRNWVITSSNPINSVVKLRGYYTATEANNLVNAVGCMECVSSRDGFDVAALRYSGVNEDGLYNNNTAAGVVTFLNDSTDVLPYENGYYAEWSTNALSEWWITSPVTRRNGTLTRMVSSSSDDAEEHETNGSVNPIREVLTLTDRDGHQRIGWRFKNITIPSGTYITSAFIKWISKNNSTGPATWTLQSEISPDANTFTTLKYNISLRPRSTQVVQWDPVSWIENATYSSPDISHLIQNVIDQPAWINGKDLVLTMSGVGSREAWSYNGDPLKGAQLIITYSNLCAFNAIVYVDKNATGLQNGSSWTNAYRSLGQALDRVSHCPDANQIWIADGVYSPYAEVPRTNYFSIPPGIQIYGGFQGTESSVGERLYGVFPTVLSGDIGTSNLQTDNLYHVIYIQPGAENVLLDGISVEKGMANGSLPDQQTGGGIYNLGKLYGNQLIILNNSLPSIYNGTGSELRSTGVIEIRQ